MDVRGQYAALLEDVKRAACEVIDSGRFVLGPQVRAFEEELAAAVGASHAVGVANGTDALVLSLEALGVGAGDEVITTAYTFYATAEAIAAVGATPVFVDVDPVTYNIDPALVEAAVGERTRAVVAVHVFGQPADLGALRDLTSRCGIALVEDAAQAFGATYDGRRVGSFGDVATFSFYPTKNFPAMGDGGAVTSRSGELADRIRLLRFHGSRDKRTFHMVGHNSRLDELQAAILRRFLPHVEEWNAARRRVADRYRALGLGELLGLPEEGPSRAHVYHLYVARSDGRDEVLAALRAADIGAASYYSTPLHRQPVFAHLGYAEGSLPETERLGRQGIALPMFPTLDEERQRQVVEAVRAATRATV
jgi:dTDP-4-amino-4,6-dideoxygalactose transaminase